MANIATLLKSEITRLSKKVIRQHVDPLRTSQTAQRRQLAKLRREVLELQKEVATLRRKGKTPQPPSGATNDTSKVRFVPKGLKTLRKRLGFTAQDAGLMLDVSAQTIFNWESGAKPPRSKVLTIAALRGMHKKEAQWRLAELKEQSSPKKRRK